MVRVGVGISTQRDPRLAGRSAAKLALKNAGTTSCDFVLVFATVGYDQETLLRAIRETTANAPLAGCSGAGIIAQKQRQDSNHAVAVMVWQSDTLHFRAVGATRAQDDSLAGGRAVLRAMGALPSDTRGVFVFADGVSTNFDALRREFEGMLPQGVPMFGGMAADGGRMARTFQYHDDQVLEHGVVAVVLSGEGSMSTGFVTGCAPLEPAHTVTGSERGSIVGLDGRRVDEVLVDYLGASALRDRKDPIVELCVGFERAGADGSSALVARAFRRCEDGGLALYGDAPRGSKAWMMIRDEDAMQRGVETLRRELRAEQEAKPKLVIYVESAFYSKNFLLEQETSAWLGHLQSTLELDAPWIGFCSFGEIVTERGQTLSLDYTAALAVIR